MFATKTSDFKKQVIEEYFNKIKDFKNYNFYDEDGEQLPD